MIGHNFMAKLTCLSFPKYQNSPFKVAPQPYLAVAPTPYSKARFSLIFPEDKLTEIYKKMYRPSKSTIIGTFAELTVFNIRTALTVGEVVVSG